jgi:hypothetical protein
MVQQDHSQREIIRLAALDLEPEETSRIVCPYCNASHETSMRIFRNEVGIHAKCYRAKCGKYVFISGLPQMRRRRDDKQFKPKYYHHEYIEPPVEVKMMLYDEYQLDTDDILMAQFKYNAERNELVMPIKDIRGYTIGTQTKRLGTFHGPKNMTYYSNDTVKAHFVLPNQSRTVAVVEDILSATKVGKLMPCCALLSHEMTEEVAHLLATNFDHVIMMLDPDATRKALTTKKRFSFFFRNFSVIVLSKDPKDTDFNELEEKLLGATDINSSNTIKRSI